MKDYKRKLYDRPLVGTEWESTITGAIFRIETVTRAGSKETGKVERLKAEAYDVSTRNYQPLTLDDFECLTPVRPHKANLGA